ncbi:MAG TPA: hypothetical protein VJV79_19160 [Polyangiaceae bacterium]|nr:hypothetical protein [Polyangiaceae bacterium]
MRSRKATLVVIEFGASWPRWLDPSHSGDMAVVAQHYEGAPSSLITQVASRVTRLEAKGWQLNAIVFVSNGRCEGDSAAARSILAHGLLSRLRAAGGGHFALTVDDRHGRRAAHNLTLLAESMDRAARVGGVVLSTRAGEQTPGTSLDTAALAS